jgi:hypothetical protein
MSRRRDRAWADYSAAFRRDVLPRLLSSAYMLTIAEGVPSAITNDVIQQATELGLMLLLDKPLVVIVPTGADVPATLRRAATELIDDVDMDDPASQDRIAEVFRRLRGSR